jgi:ribonuclease HI
MSNLFHLRNQFTSNFSYLLQFDGGANPNPGPCAGAFVIYKMNQDKEILFEGGKYIAEGTNNIGEYMGLLEGLRICIEQKFDSILIEGDSKLVVYQITNQWKVNFPHIQFYHSEIHKLLQKFDSVSIRHVYREQNKKADQLSDETLEKKQNWIRF